MPSFLSVPPPQGYSAPPPSQPMPALYRAPFRSQAHDREVWGSVMATRLELFSQHEARISPRYLEGFAALGLARSEPPPIANLSQAVALLGWTAVHVDGFIPGDVYAALINNRVFPVANFLRRPEWLTHSPLPDYVHDVIGHLPQLFSRTLRDYMSRIAGVMASLPKSPREQELFERTHRHAWLVLDGAEQAEIAEARAALDVIEELVRGEHTPLSRVSRLFLWTVELGVTGTPDDFRISGAGLLSSESELRLVLGSQARFEPFDVDVVTRTDIDFTGLQHRYFLAQSFDDYDRALDVLMKDLDLT